MPITSVSARPNGRIPTEPALKLLLAAGLLWITRNDPQALAGIAAVLSAEIFGGASERRR